VTSVSPTQIALAAIVTAACAFDNSRNCKNRWHRANLSKFRVRVAAMTQALPHCSNSNSVIESFWIEACRKQIGNSAGVIAL
jgi:hypothetical protein